MTTLVPRLSEIEAATAAAREPNAVALAEAFASQQTPEDDRWKLLIQVFQMMLRAGNAAEPFEPILRTGDGRRSMIPSDLTSGDLEALRSVFPDRIVPRIEPDLVMFSGCESGTLLLER